MARTYLTKARESGPIHMFVATAAYQFHANYTHALAAGMALLAREGIPADLCHIAEHCHVDDARNAMVREFLMSDATHLVFIDNDVGFPAENLLTLARIRPEVDMVAGVYPLKEAGEGYPVRLAEGVELWADDDGLVEVEGLPTGFLRISRNCIGRMVERFGERKFYGRGQSHDDPPHVVLFERTYENGTRYSGDYAFCEKWKSIGGKLYVYPEMAFSHSGINEWQGTLGDYWRKEFGVVEQRFHDAIGAMSAGKFNGEIAQNLIAGWDNPFAANVNTLVSCWYAAKKAKYILEAGSGLTTMVMALANPEADIITLESEPYFATHLRKTFERYGINNVIIHCAPLVSYDAGKWYESFPSMEFDLVLLDGPNRKKSNRAVAFQVLDRVLQDATVIMDDADDAALLAAFNQWAEASGRAAPTLIGLTQKNAAISVKQ